MRHPTSVVFRNVFMGGIGFLPFLGITVGFIFNLLGIERPDIFGLALKWLIPIATFFTMFAIGLTFNFRRIMKYKNLWPSISLIKFIYTPILGLLLAYFVGYSNLLMKVVFIEVCMPVAISSVMMANLFALEKDLSNSCWMVTNLFVVPLVPIILLIANIL